MSDEHEFDAGSYVGADRLLGATGERAQHTLRGELLGYALGLTLAVLLTIGSFWMQHTRLVYGPGLAVGLLVLAVAQMGVHLVFFLHLTTDPDNSNNILALAFGVLIVSLVVFGSLWVMTHMNQNMMPMEQMLQMQR